MQNIMAEESKFNKIKKDMVKHKGFSFSRVPEKTRKEFFKYAKDEWADDRGAALTHIFKFFMGECSTGHEEIDAKIEILAAEITEIKTHFKKEEEEQPQEVETEKRLDGKDHKL